MWTSRLMSIGFLGSTLALTVMSSPSSGEIISCLLADEAEPIGIDPERPTL